MIKALVLCAMLQNPEFSELHFQNPEFSELQTQAGRKRNKKE